MFVFSLTILVVQTEDEYTHSPLSALLPYMVVVLGYNSSSVNWSARMHSCI